ncbi:hypothetical protein T459_31467 [Capsicum annuum]|uniref:Leucine-rich repeat-containing N-terminal plant-type domain-containing protein n=1 Tax=Capsicum annuum TaxID=4072 RepID=A0A2G2YBA4_CAPAN|nr:hypothetical protein T459_31467 [Capsicum annuum]
MGYGRLLLLLLASFFLRHEFAFSFSSLAPQSCPEDQSLALIEFNKTLVVNASLATLNCQFYEAQKAYPRTSSWVMSKDCCSWDGVICDEMTGHVIELNLSCSQLVGNIDTNSSLFQLTYLQRLDLSGNDFSNSQISPNFGRFTSLTHLDLSHSSFSGQIPSEISHLSKLQSLGLSGDFALFFDDELGLPPHDFKLILQNLTQLRELDLRYVNIFSSIPLNFSSHLTTLKLGGTGLNGIIPESIFHLPNLQVLNLEGNNALSGNFSKTKWNSSRSLVDLSLSAVNFSGDFLPYSLVYVTSLQFLVLYSCNLLGPIPKSLWNLTHLEYLDLRNNHLEGQLEDFRYSSALLHIDISNNQLKGYLPKSIQNLVNVAHIDLVHNQLQGPLPKSLQNLVNLTWLDLSSNNFNGSVDVSVFSNLKNLNYLSLSYNSISLTNENEVRSTLPQSLEYLFLSACEVRELDILRSATILYYLDLSNNKIQGRIPDWVLPNWTHSMSNLNLSYNMLTSIGPIPRIPLNTIDLRSNNLQGSLPNLLPTLQYLFISNNNLKGEIPLSFCNLTSLKVLDLARNNLKGAFPQCLSTMTYLEVLDVQHNSLSGDLLTTFIFGSGLKSFNLHGNMVEGKIPRSLANCMQLEALDLGNNYQNDTFPMWLGTLSNLQVLSLRSNKLHGAVRTSTSLKLFPQLWMLDLSCNAFTAELPTSLFRNLKAMRRIDQTMKVPVDRTQRYYQDSVTVVTKGLELKVVGILSLYTTMDLSSNKFEGHIPSMMGDLIALRVLNLSHNGLQGPIPPSLGKLSVVESLDLSSNKLSGEIPKQLASLTSLAVLNLSRNHLEGCIPKGPQFATFENNSYEGNDGLRGFPVSGGCGSHQIPETNNTTFVPDEESDLTFLSELSWKVVLMGYGCGLIIGFSISYFMLSSRKPNWLSRVAEDLEYRIIMRS